MNRIDRVFTGRNRPAFIAFTVAGDPDPETSVRVAEALATAGADIIELGMPYSDPSADGPMIQRADLRALEAGTTPDTLFAIIRGIRRRSTVPIMILTYYNPIFRRGIDRFYREAADAGADGILIVDLPAEEIGVARTAADRYGLCQIVMAAPTTTDERLDLIGSAGSGFLYVVSVAGVTGARDHLAVGVADLLERIRSRTALPLAVGFGISRPEHVQAIAAAGGDAAIVGSAIAAIIEEHTQDRDRMIEALRVYVTRMRGALEP
ncbi:tryptophan synthase subunit alpha [Methanosphaerula subterraneus]|uniref:tryptophan synthase subunit alpha n=1 Tax=Methanosphaerula subterraneus TaxID=3350244 RepID=UPI003F85A08D